MTMKKWILPFLLFLTFSCDFVGKENLEERLLEVWLYSSRMICAKEISSEGLCYYYSTSENFDDTLWESLNYVVDDFGFETGYYYNVLLEKYLFEFDPVDSLDEQGRVIKIETPEPEERYRVKTINYKFRDFMRLFSGTWILEKVNGIDNENLLSELNKIYTVDPLRRKVNGKYHCNDLELKIRDFFDFNQIDLSESFIVEKECDSGKIYRDIEDLIMAKFSIIRRYEIVDSYWILKDAVGYEQLRLRRANRSPRGEKVSKEENHINFQNLRDQYANIS